jgi:hypothetical protein
MCIPRDGGGPAAQGPLSRVAGLVEQAFGDPKRWMASPRRGRAPPGV